MLTIQIKKSNKAKELGLNLIKAHSCDAGWDVPVCLGEELGDGICLLPGDKRDIPSGIYIHIPEGYWAEIKARGSTFMHRGLHVHDAVWDAGYNGEISVAVMNNGDKPVLIRNGERLAQLILHNVVDATFVEKDDDLPVSERHTSCMGSSGV